MTEHLDKYREHIAELNLPACQEDILLEALWQFTGDIADNAWGLNPANLACGQVEEFSPKAALTAPIGVRCLHTLISEEFEKAAGAKALYSGGERESHESEHP